MAWDRLGRKSLPSAPTNQRAEAHRAMVALVTVLFIGVAFEMGEIHALAKICLPVLAQMQCSGRLRL
jgi:hypothetical protein